MLAACRQARPAALTACDLLARMTTRPFEGRLTCAMPFRPFRPERPRPEARSRQPATRGDLGAALSAAAHRAGHGAAERAALALVRGRIDEAIDLFVDTLATEPETAALHNDAAVAYLERGRLEVRPFDLLAGLRHARRAVDLAPRSQAALFNLGLALDTFQLRYQAMNVWQRCLELDGTSAWAPEIRRRLAENADETFEQRWEALRAALRRREPLPPAALRRAVESYPDQLRELALEEILPAAAGELSAGSTRLARPATALASALAAEMTARRGDAFLADALASLLRGRGGRRRLAAAHRDFAAAMARYHGQEFRIAGEMLGRTVPVLREAGSPLAWEARFYQAVCVYFSDSRHASAPLRSLLAEIDQRRYPSLAGRTLWMLGTSAMVEGRHEEAIAAFQRIGSPQLQGAGEAQTAVAEQLLGENYELRGEIERGWRHRLKALQVLVPRGTPRRRYAVLQESARALVRRHQLDLALVFLDDAIAAADAWGELSGRGEALSLRARVWAELAERQRALADAESALAAVAAMPEGGARRRLEGEALISRGEARLAADPAAACRDIERGRSLEAATGWAYDSTFAATLLAAGQRRLGDRPAAKKSLFAAVQSYERIRDEAMEPRAKIAVFEHAQEAFEGLMELALDDSGGLSTAFDWAERSRRRYLVDAWATRNGSRRTAATVDAREVRQRLPADVTLVEFAVLPEQTIAWVIENGALRGRVLPISRSRLSRQVETYRRALEKGGGARDLGAALFDLVLRPLAALHKPGQRLVIVPDGPLEQVPFVALFDRVRGSYLVEQATVTIAPSATVLISLLSRRVASHASGRSALVVGAPDLSSTRHADLPALAGAADEARIIAKLYPRHTLLLGPAAARAEFLRQLPRHGVLHFAGHALAPAGAGQSSLFLLAPSPGDDGEVSATELRDLELPGLDLVVLAACSSLAGYDAGREGALSLASSFLAAGVPSVVAAWWSVDDRTSPRLMLRFHAFVASGTDPPAALRQVMLECLRGGDRELAMPRSWAVFTLLGL
jgi:CHAT domain-containing protein